MAHEVETMAYANQTPWHGLGTPVADNLTPAQMLNAAGLNWQVKKKALVVDELDHVLTSHYALVRDTDSKILAILLDHATFSKAFTFVALALIFCGNDL